MPYVYSTSTNSSAYTTYRNSEGNVPLIEKQVVIKGGANRANKQLVTPYGVPTLVTDQDLEFLMQNEEFKKHLSRGFLTVRDDKVDVEVAVADMNKRDESAPAVPEDFGNGDNKRFAKLMVKNDITE